MSIWTARFWKQTTERAIKTAAQSVALAYSMGEGFNAFDVDWQLAGGFALGGALFSILTSIASAPIGEPTTPSLV